ncbi:MAG: YceI family protein [Gloeobacteraceae cyanobacterium ES-bin-316]|nr:YceI family protein [Ferruginibacter sp.]
MTTKKFKIVGAQSNIEWTGKKVTGSHNGTISITAGTLLLNENKLIGGDFIIDVSSIKILDITDPATKAQFAGHLFSEDFFAIERFPEASFIITNADQVTGDRYTIVGDLTIKGITNPVRFDAYLHAEDDVITASGKIVIDRTKYDIKFRSGNFFQNLGDTLIYNDFELNVNLTAEITL